MKVWRVSPSLLASLARQLKKYFEVQFIDLW